jgi:uncharacterized protein YndB with AHSA1/START domain
MLRAIGLAALLSLSSILLIVVVGYALPIKHLAARSILLGRSPTEVFALIFGFKDQASWRSEIQEIEMLPVEAAHVRFREKSAHGSITMQVVESDPPRRLVTQIDDKSLPFGGIWIFDVLPSETGSRLHITERGEVYNPIFRFVSRFFLGYNKTIDTYLINVARKFGENEKPGTGQAAELTRNNKGGRRTLIQQPIGWVAKGYEFAHWIFVTGKRCLRPRSDNRQKIAAIDSSNGESIAFDATHSVLLVKYRHCLILSPWMLKCKSAMPLVVTTGLNTLK